jgi:hypothetical protein
MLTPPQPMMPHLGKAGKDAQTGHLGDAVTEMNLFFSARVRVDKAQHLSMSSY